VRGISVVVCLLAAALVVSGCGGSSRPSGHSAETSSSMSRSSSTTARPVTTTTLLTKELFLERAHAICDAMNERRRVFGNYNENLADQQRFRQWADGTAIVISDALTKLRALPVPPSEARSVARLLTAFETALGSFQRIALATHASDRNAENSAVDAYNRDGAVAHLLLVAYALPECG
jgi:hypothetical protein